MEIERFTIDVDNHVLIELRDRILKTRWPDRIPGIGWQHGTELEYLKSLLGYWADGYDWRAQERRLNTFDQFRAEVDGVHLHFVHQRARNGDGIPLILTHGWPGSFVEYLPVVAMLTDPQAHGITGPAFDVIVPSLPGYGYSERPARTGVDYRYTAQLWRSLMRGLGYEHYGAAGSDFGSGVATYMALQDPDRLLGIYLSTLEIVPYSGEGSRPLSAAESAYQEKNERWWAAEGGYVQIQATKPQTLSYGLNDSPAGLAAWILEKWQTWSDTGGDIDAHFSRDLLLTNIMLYWVTGTIGSSIRDYSDNLDYFTSVDGVVPGLHDRVTVPTGFSSWPADFGGAPLYGPREGLPPREWVERLYNIQQWTDMPCGGHFASVEEPELYARDVARFFAKVAKR
ncbi:epoxide hydrolase family protein [Nocardia rhamnosiphila]